MKDLLEEKLQCFLWKTSMFSMETSMFSMENSLIEAEGDEKDANLPDKFLHHDEKALCRFEPVKYLYHTRYICHLESNKIDI